MADETPVLSRNNTAGHLAVLYDDIDDQMHLLAQYFEEGQRKHELCVFVTAIPAEEAIDKLAAHGFDAAPAVEEGSLRIFGMLETYLQDGEFVAEYMLKNVEDFLRDARAAGYKGLRTAGEMSWIGDHPHFQPAAESYEADINGLTNPNEDIIGLCMYPASGSFGRGVLGGVLKTHPTYFYDNHLHVSPTFAA